MKSISPLKTLPLSAIIAIALALSPALSMADNGERGRYKSKHASDVGKSHNKGQSHHDKRSFKKPRKQHNVAHGYDRHGYDKHRRNKHGHKKQVNNYYYVKPYSHSNHHHNHGYNGHTHTNYVVHDYGHDDHYLGLDNLRFMFGLHTGNFDIVIRD